MAVNTAPLASYDLVANTVGRSVDSTLWPMLTAKSQFLDRVKVGAQVNEPKVEWLSANSNVRQFTAIATGNTLATSSSATAIGCTSFGPAVQVGALIVNASRATSIGTYKVDEVMQITSITGTGPYVINVTRDYGNNNAGVGSTANVATDTYNVLFTPKGEGSLPDANKYVKTTVSYNETSILDFYLTVTGTELNRSPLIVADNMTRQYDDRTTELMQDVTSLIYYGAMNNGSPDGSATAIRTTRGILQALSMSGSLLDYTTQTVTSTAIDNLFESLFEAGNPMNANYAIVTHPKNGRVITHFGDSFVKIDRVDKGWGRYVTTYISDLGATAEIISDPMCSKSNLFILNMDKIELVPYRPWRSMEWGIDTSSPDGSDSYKKRVLGEYTVKVIDPLKSHAGFGYLTW